MFDTLSDRLQDVLQQVKGADRLTADNVDGALREVRKALLDGDVSLKATKLFLSRVREAAVGERVVRGITPSQKFIEIVQKELTSLLGGEAEELHLGKDKPAIIMLLGLQGAGKTTTAAKLALRLRKPLLIAADLQRPAAAEQLQILGDQAGIDVYREPATDALAVARNGIDHARQQGYETVVLDTAGRLQIDSDLMAELLLLDREFHPREKLLVVDALIGQEAANVAKTFDTQIGITGNILTKLDGDSRGGAALSVVEETGKKIKFASYGEKLEPLEKFDPERIAGRILGFGDVVALVEQAEANVDKQEAEALNQHLQKGELSFDIFLRMQRVLAKLGGLRKVFGLMGLGSEMGLDRKQESEALEAGEQKFKKYQFAIQSMTPEEQRRPELMSQRSRLQRVARGSGLQEKAVQEMVREFEEMRGMLKVMAPMLSGGNAASTDPRQLAAQAQKAQKKSKKSKKDGKGPFKGGSFLRF